MERIFIHLGSNLGNRKGQLQLAQERIRQEIGAIVARSALYETQAWGDRDQPDFLNMAIEVETALGPAALMQTLLKIEAEMGRQRTETWEPRIIDLDILAYGGQVLDTPELTLPHPRLHLRNFVLVPLMDIAAEWEHPVLQQTIEDLYWSSPDELEVIRLDEETPGL